MSLSANNEKSYKLPKLDNADQYPRWIASVNTLCFTNARQPDAKKINSHTMLDIVPFKKTGSPFKDRITKASKDDDNNAVDPFVHDPDLLTDCYEHALQGGDFFHPWVYTLNVSIRNSLGTDLHEKGTLVRDGDIPELLSTIELAVQHREPKTSLEIHKDFMDLTMENCGNDLLKYLAVLQQHQRRLAAMGKPMADDMAQFVLLEGLHPIIFAPFYTDAVRNPFGSYNALTMALKDIAKRKGILNQLKPCTPKAPRPP